MLCPGWILQTHHSTGERPDVRRGVPDSREPVAGRALTRAECLSGAKTSPLLLATGAVQLSGALLRRLVITEHQVAQVQGESGAAVVSERLRVITLRGAENDNVVCLRQGGNQVRGGFVTVLVARQGDVVRLLVLVSSAGFRASGGKVSLEDVLNTAHQLSIGQGAVIRGERNVDAVQSLVGVLTRVVSGGKSVAGE